MIKDAKFYEKLDDTRVKCRLCPHNCIIKNGLSGLCGVRKVEDGKLYTINYGEVTSIALDPIEKKPLYHFKPGKKIISVGSFGCNFKCGFCQNYSISQYKSTSRYIEPGDLIKLALEYKSNGNTGIAFTYNEPSIWYEYIFDTVRECNDALDIVLVSNGYIAQEALKELLPYVDAMNIDLKAFNDEFYSKTCGGELKNVLNTIETAAGACHVELTTLIIDGYNDNLDEIEKLAKWVSSINKDIPLHFSKYYPAYKFNIPETPDRKVIEAAETAKKYLSYVYIGNIWGVNNDTICPNCGKVLIKRRGSSTEINIDKGVCSECGREINIML